MTVFVGPYKFFNPKQKGMGHHHLQHLSASRGPSDTCAKQKWRHLGATSVFWGQSFFPRIFVWGSCFWFCIPACFSSASSTSAASHTIYLTQLCHTTSSHTHNFVAHNLSNTIFVAHNFVTHTHFFRQNFVAHNLSNTIFVTHTMVHTQLCDTQLCCTQSITHNLSHAIFVTHNFVTYNLSDTTLSHTHTIFVPFASLALDDIDPRFACQVWLLGTSTLVLRCRRGRYLGYVQLN